jgi:peptidoglycan/xylan/chitin deacetylase (PgdA/CDA1 family)
MSLLRIDRAVSVYFFRRFVRNWRHGEYRIPILMYHRISEERSHRNPYYELNTAPNVFAEHMRYLRENSYEVVDLESALCSLTANCEERKRRVAITFDDGSKDFYTAACPILKESGFTATVFLVSGLTKDQPFRADGVERMTWEEARNAHSLGMRIGSHTVSHLQLTALPHAQIIEEIRHSKDAIEQRVGAEVTSFSYPYAFPEANRAFTRGLQSLLGAHGYRNGVSTIIGTASASDNPLFLPRLPVNTCDDLPLFEAKLQGAYDWLHTFQYCAKFMALWSLS